MNIERIVTTYFKDRPYITLLSLQQDSVATPDQQRQDLVKLRDELEHFRGTLVNQAARIDGDYPPIKAWHLGGLVAILTVIVRRMDEEIGQLTETALIYAKDQR